MRLSSRVVLLAVLGLWAACSGACSSSDGASSGNKCTPGQSAACACPDGKSGAQQCQPDGTFAACVCGSAGAGGAGATGGAGGGGAAGQDGGGAGGQATGGAAGQGAAGGTAGQGGTDGGTTPDSLVGEWSKVFPSYFTINAISVTPTGTIVVAGPSLGPVDFGNGPVGTAVSDPAFPQIIVAAFDANGQRKFAFAKDAGRFKGTTLAMKAISDDLILVSGITEASGSGSFYGLSWPCGNKSASVADQVAFVSALDQNGNCVWDHNYYAPPLVVVPTALGATSDGSTFMSAPVGFGTWGAHGLAPDGTESWAAAFGGTEIDDLSTKHVLVTNYHDMTLPAGTQTGLFVMAELDTAGGVVASKAFGSQSSEYPGAHLGLDTGPGDRVAIAVHYTGTVDLGGGPLTSTDSGASPSKLFAVLGPGFTHVFSKSINEPKSDSNNTDDSVTRAILGASSATYAGQFWRSVDFGDGALTAVGTSDTDFDIFVARYALDGTPAVSRRFGGPGPDSVNVAAGDATGATYLAGAFTTSVDFGDGLHTHPPTDAGAPAPTPYLVKLTP